MGNARRNAQLAAPQGGPSQPVVGSAEVRPSIALRVFPSWLCAFVPLLGGCDGRRDDEAVSGKEIRIPSHDLSGPAHGSNRSPSAPRKSPPVSVGDALAELSNQTDPEKRVQRSAEISSDLAGGELVTWAVNLQSHPVTEARDTLLETVLGKLAARQPRDAFELAVQTTPKASARKLTQAVARVWAKSDYRSLSRFADDLPRDQFLQEIQEIVAFAWTAENPTEAFHHFATLDYDEGGVSIWVPARALARADSGNALALLETFDNERVWDSAAGRIFDVIAQRDFPQAIELFFEQTDPAIRTNFAYALGSNYAVDSVDEGIDFLNQLPDTASAYHFIHGMIHRLRTSDFEPLMKSLDRIEDSSIRETAALSVGRDLGSIDPTRATAWLPTIAQSDVRQHAFQGVGMSYANVDGAAAQAWLGSLPPGDDRRHATFGFASEYANQDPLTSTRLALTIAETDVRGRLMTVILRRWHRQDPTQALAWATANGYAAQLPKR